MMKDILSGGFKLLFFSKNSKKKMSCHKRRINLFNYSKPIKIYNTPVICSESCPEI